MNPLLPVLILVTTCCVPAVASAQSAPPHLSPAPSHLLWQRPASVLTAEWPASRWAGYWDRETWTIATLASS